MGQRLRIAALLSACALGLSPVAQAAPAPAAKDLQAVFDAQVDPTEMGGWLKRLAAEPNHVGSPHNKANAEWVAARLKSWGWDARIETFYVLNPRPISVGVELLDGSGAPFKATLTEPPVASDADTATKTALPAYLAYQGDGDVTAPLVYVNYGMPADYEALDAMGVSVKGRILIARYGGGWRGLKPKLAQEHGAVGAIIYSDPRDDGYAIDDVYPKGGARPAASVQRGSVLDLPVQPGDPLTPGIGATRDAPRLNREAAGSILKIPVLPMSYGDAKVLLAALDGPVAPVAWQGGLPITYHVGPSARVRLTVKSDWSLTPIHNVIAMMRGAERPDEWVIRGNHRDGWVMGATDPLSGQVALLAEAKAFGVLARAGWKPRRTLVYASWDAEEPGLIGSTEWVEAHADELRAKAVIYINSDSNGRGFLSILGSQDYQALVSQAAAEVKDPQTGVSVSQRLRAKIAVDAAAPGASEAARTLGRLTAAPASDLPMAALGSGSDFTPFLQHLGVPVINLGYGGEDSGAGVYHSLYDDYEHHSRFVDPGFAYDALLAKTVGLVVRRIADADLPVQRFGPFADAVAGYVAEVKTLAATRNDEAATRAPLLASNAYGLAADPRRPHAPPPALPASPTLNFAPLDAATARLKAGAAAFDKSLAAKGVMLDRARKSRLDAALRPLGQTLVDEAGLPGRPWYRNMVYAPGLFTGYGVKTLPGVREAIEERRFDDAARYVDITAQVLTAYAAGLERATAILDGR